MGGHCFSLVSFVLADCGVFEGSTQGNEWYIGRCEHKKWLSRGSRSSDLFGISGRSAGEKREHSYRFLDDWLLLSCYRKGADALYFAYGLVLA